MLKSSPIFERNGAQLVKKWYFKKIKIIHSWSLNALNMQKHFLFLLRYEYVNFAKLFQNNLWQSKLLCFICDLSNVQKCNFKKCPLTWVAPLTMFLLHCDKIKDYPHVDN
jgi:hypothetical protein